LAKDWGFTPSLAEVVLHLASTLLEYERKEAKELRERGEG
jgi:hypothetical protein